MPHKSQPLHFSGCTTCGGWYPFELKAEESASTCVGQNSTQKPQALQRSTTIETRPFATWTPSPGATTTPDLQRRMRLCVGGEQSGVMPITYPGEAKHELFLEKT